MILEPHSTYKVRFSDCDPLGHLANSRYLDYMIGARSDQNLEFYNFDMPEHAKKSGCTWVVKKNLITYIKEVRYNTTVDILTRVIKVSEKYLIIEMIMYNEDRSLIHALLWNYLSYFSLLKRTSEKHSPQVLRLFDSLLIQIPHSTFEERERYYRNLNRAVKS